ncbi:glycosyltransferase [Microbulbifer sp. SH-1]|uniref:glycosyltransferase family 4 protein n=1 Tax=Microbulbifer sp. SH-1 TaxID=2681547 RepID=UPI00140C69A2|nr:glycosyltransferase family 4 protein [Microbulbifer sp. SH-1]QIL91225.1 glycosyltransferase [Microbulbifer sp. SH-1]
MIVSSDIVPVESPLRICHLFTSQETGGLEKHVQEQCQWQLESTDAEIFVIAHPRYRAMFPEGVRFLPMNTDRSRRNPVLNLALLRQLRRYRIDLVHAHGGKPAHLLWNLRRFLRARVVITRHNRHHPKDKIARHFEHRIAVSLKTVANSSLDWTIIPNGTRLPSAGEHHCDQVDCNRAVVISVARLVPAKGVDVLLRAWCRAQVNSAVLYILGDGPERAALEALAAELNLEESVRFMGYQRQVADWYRAADLTVIASRYEGGPYTVAEALLAGCPVVSTDVGYVAENIPAQYLVQIEDVPALAVRLTAALGDVERLRGEFAPYIARARNRLTLEAMAGETWKVYLRALSGD